MTQKVICIFSTPLFADEGAPRTALQPPDPEQIGDADQRAAGIGDLGDAALARAMIDRNIDRTMALAQEQRRHEAMHTIKTGQRQESVAAKNLQPQGAVGAAIPQ